VRDEELLLAWLHLSDIHCSKEGGANSTDRKRILTVLKRDVEAFMGEGQVPKPSALIVTGDIAATGDEPKSSTSAGEYDAATQWLDAFCTSLRIARSAVLLVPGNHDVQRPQDLDRNVKRLIDDLRRGGKRGERIEDALDHAADRAMIVRRQKNYIAFSQDFGPRDAERDPDGLWWSARLGPVGKQVRVTGLNTALLARDNKDCGLLRLGGHQLNALVCTFNKNTDLSLALTHHPLSGGWLRDEKDVVSWFKSHVDVHLSGHVHGASSEGRHSGAGSGFVTVSAGAVHAGAPNAQTRCTERADTRNHCYNFAALYRLGDGNVVLRVWHRRWSSSNAAFRSDIDQVGRSGFAEHPIIACGPRGRSPSAPPGPSDTRSILYPDPIDLKTISIADAASVVQSATGLRIELLFQGNKKVALWVKPIHCPLDERKCLLLKTACLLAGDKDTEEISIGFADTSDLCSGMGKDKFLVHRLLFPAGAVRKLAVEKNLAPDFWSSVIVEFVETPVSPIARKTVAEWPDYEARLV